VEIVATGVEVIGAHGPLLAPTSLRARTGQVLLVVGDPNSGRTALALALSGRLRPTRGTVRLDGAIDATALRRRVAVVDAPQITEPDGALVVRDVVAEGLSLAGRRSGHRRVRDWLSARGWHVEGEARFEKLAGFERTRLLLELAREASATEALVLDCPDRHGGDPHGWHSLAARHAEHGLAVIALCSPHSADRLGVSAARVGADNPEMSTLDTTEGLR
jgi:ABC-type cobalamin/Fe3+-siderophores transport system ATPase subunit